jgi:hypothetical protein
VRIRRMGYPEVEDVAEEKCWYSYKAHIKWRLQRKDQESNDRRRKKRTSYDLKGYAKTNECWSRNIYQLYDNTQFMDHER